MLRSLSVLDRLVDTWTVIVLSVRQNVLMSCGALYYVWTNSRIGHLAGPLFDFELVQALLSSTDGHVARAWQETIQSYLRINAASPSTVVVATLDAHDKISKPPISN